jgi:hypothetical protein
VPRKPQVNEFPKAPDRAAPDPAALTEAMAEVGETRLLPQMTAETRSEVQEILGDMWGRNLGDRAKLHRIRELLFGDGYAQD